MHKCFRKLRLFAPVMGMLLLVSAGPMLTACDSGPTGPGGSGGCCKVCTTGKACGDSCIASNKTCNKGSGCACNG